MLAASNAIAVTLRLGIQETVLFDNNVFRLPSGTEATLGQHHGRSDLTSRTNVIVNLDQDISLQRFQLNASISRTEYLKFSEISYTGVNADAKWSWDLGSRLSGDAGAHIQRQLSSFADFRAFERNVATQWQPYFDIRYMTGARVFVYGSYKRVNTSNSSDVLLVNDYVSDVGSVGLGYSFYNEGEVAVGAKRTATNFDSTQLIILDGVSSALHNDYRQNELEAKLIWPIGFRGKFNGRIAYTQRRNREVRNRDFGGFTGSASLNYDITYLVNLSVSGRRELAGTDDILAYFATTNGAHIRFEYKPRDFAKFDIDGDYARRNYRGFDVFLPIVGTGRRDTNWSASAKLRYEWPLGSWIEVAYRHERRISNVPVLDFSDDSVSLSALYQF